MTLQDHEMTNEAVENLLNSLCATYDHLRTEVQGPLDFPKLASLFSFSDENHHL